MDYEKGKFSKGSGRICARNRAKPFVEGSLRGHHRTENIYYFVCLFILSLQTTLFLEWSPLP